MGILEEIREYFASTQNGAREIKIRPWKDYSRSIDLKMNDENVTLTFSIGQTATTNHEEQKGSYNIIHIFVL